MTGKVKLSIMIKVKFLTIEFGHTRGALHFTNTFLKCLKISTVTTSLGCSLISNLAYVHVSYVCIYSKGMILFLTLTVQNKRADVF